jgi:guanyl-specific ribonuclease Sa
MLGVLILSLATIWGRQTGNSTSVQALESSSASTSAAQTASPDPKAVTWEYKMLSGDLSQVV